MRGTLVSIKWKSTRVKESVIWIYKERSTLLLMDIVIFLMYGFHYETSSVSLWPIISCRYNHPLHYWGCEKGNHHTDRRTYWFQYFIVSFVCLDLILYPLLLPSFFFLFLLFIDYLLSFPLVLALLFYLLVCFICLLFRCLLDNRSEK